MTAKEWSKTPWGSTPEAKHLLDDLAACERERDKWHDEANEYKAGFWRETNRLALLSTADSEQREVASDMASLADAVNQIARQACTGEAVDASLAQIRDAMWRVEYRRLSLQQEVADLRRKLEETAKASHAHADDCDSLREELEDCRRKLEEAVELLEWTEDDDWWCEPGFAERRDALLAKLGGGK